jgi:succinyl-CoA synthetase beta subunit/citryl-CoA synthetase large subunit
MLSLQAGVVIEGYGANDVVIKAAPGVRVFDVNTWNPGDVRISGVTITGGSSVFRLGGAGAILVGGGSLTLFDAVRRYGGKPANYCEIGGNPSVSKAKNLTKLVLEKPGVDKIAVMMSIVSNTRVDIVARGVIKACLELGKDPGETIAVFRIPGAWEEEGFKILQRYGVEHFDRSVSMWEAAGRAVEKIQGGSA